MSPTPLVCLAWLQAAPGAGSSIFSFAPILLMFALAWFLLIRPVQKQRREQEAMRSALKSGDAILTSGGLYGTIVRVKDDRVVVRISDRVNCEVAKSAVVSVVEPREGH